MPIDIDKFTDLICDIFQFCFILCLLLGKVINGCHVTRLRYELWAPNLKYWKCLSYIWLWSLNQGESVLTYDGENNKISH